MVNVATLINGLIDIGPQISPISAAGLWSSAYAQYAATATDAAGNPLIFSNLIGFNVVLDTQFANTYSTSAAAADAIASAFSQFWTGAIFAPTHPAPGISEGGNGLMGIPILSSVVACPPTALQYELSQLFLTTADDTLMRVQTIASALHRATTQNVIVNIQGTDTTLPPTGPLPCAQLGHVQ